MNETPAFAAGWAGPIIGVVLAYLSGSIPMGLVLGKAKGIDIRLHGSGNIGATNAFRVLGKGLGIFCLVFDAFKGWAPVILFSALAATRPEALSEANWKLAVGCAAIGGHMYSPWIGFKGGKGVATSVGVFLAIAPAALLICVGIGVTLIATTGYVSVASILGSAMLPIMIILLPPGGERPWVVITLAAALGGFIIWRHRQNLGRLLRGQENKFFGAREATAAEPEDEEQGPAAETSDTT